MRLPQRRTDGDNPVIAGCLDHPIELPEHVFGYSQGECLFEGVVVMAGSVAVLSETGVKLGNELKSGSLRERPPPAGEGDALHGCQHDRRRIMMSTFLLGAFAVLAGCGGSEEPAATPPASGTAPPPPSPSPAPPPPPAAAPSPSPPVWNVGALTFVVGSGAVFDLAATLPAGISRGGVFGVSSAGAPLPTGMSLAPNGLLSTGSATVGDVVGVVFSYSV